MTTTMVNSLDPRNSRLLDAEEIGTIKNITYGFRFEMR